MIRKRKFEQLVIATGSTDTVDRNAEAAGSPFHRNRPFMRSIDGSGEENLYSPQQTFIPGMGVNPGLGGMATGVPGHAFRERQRMNDL